MKSLLLTAAVIILSLTAASAQSLSLNDLTRLEAVVVGPDGHAITCWTQSVLHQSPEELLLLTAWFDPDQPTVVYIKIFRFLYGEDGNIYGYHWGRPVPVDQENIVIEESETARYTMFRIPPENPVEWVPLEDGVTTKLYTTELVGVWKGIPVRLMLSEF